METFACAFISAQTSSLFFIHSEIHSDSSLRFFTDLFARRSVSVDTGFFTTPKKTFARINAKHLITESIRIKVAFFPPIYLNSNSVNNSIHSRCTQECEEKTKICPVFIKKTVSALRINKK